MSADASTLGAAARSSTGGNPGATGAALVPSAFQLFAVHWHDRVLERADVGQHLTQYWKDKASVFHLPHASQLQQALGLAASQWSVASGAAYLDSVPAKLLLAPHLRYCPECLAVGWHCALFQHIAVRWCPLHRTPLRQGCLHCKKSINLEPVSVATHQNFCPHCSFPFVSMSALRHGCEVGPDEHGPFEQLAAALMPQEDAEVAAFRSELTAHELLAADCTTLVTCAAHRSWPDEPTPGARWVPARTRSFAATEQLPMDRMNQLAYDTRRAAFERIEASLLRMGRLLAIPPVLTLATQSPGGRIGTAMDICSAAFARTAIALEMREVLPHARPARAWSTLHTDWLPRYDGAVQTVAENQIFSLYALNLVHLRRCTYTNEVAWNWRPHPASFSPPWRLRRRGGEVIIEMRPRVSEQSMLRLISRFVGRRMHSSGAGFSL